MALAATVAGSYTNTFDAVSMGETQDGFTLRFQYEKENIVADRYGDSVFDAVYRGGNCFLTLQGIQYSQVLTSGALWPYSSTTGLSGTVGVQDATTQSTINGIIVLTSTTGTTAAAAPATLTAGYAALREGTGSELNFNNRLRRVPLDFRLHLYSIGGSPGWFVLT